MKLKKMIVHRPTMKSLQVTELTEQVVTFNNCAAKAAEKVAIDKGLRVKGVGARTQHLFACAAYES